MARYAYSVAKAIYFLSPNADGSFPALSDFLTNGYALRKIAEISDDSDEPEYTQIKAKETGDVITKILTSEGAKRLKVSTYDLSPDNLNYFLGASADAYGSVTMPTSPYESERAVLIVRKAIDGVHELVYFAKAKVTARMVNDYADDNLDQIEITIEAMNPVDAAGQTLPGIKIESRPVEPVITNVDASTNTMEFAYVEPYFTSASDYEYTVDGGATWNAVSSNPISDLAITSGLAANMLGIRVARNSSVGVETGFEKYWPYAL